MKENSCELSKNIWKKQEKVEKKREKDEKEKTNKIIEWKKMKKSWKINNERLRDGWIPVIKRDQSLEQETGNARNEEKNETKKSCQK